MKVLGSRATLVLSTVSSLVCGTIFACADSEVRTTPEDASTPPDAQTLPDVSSPADGGTPSDAADASIDAARCSRGGFCFEPVPVHKQLFSVSGVTMDDAWAVASDTILHWDGDAWKSAYQYQGNDPGFFWISSRKHDDVWAIGNQTLVRYSSRDGGAPTFRDYRSPFKGSNGNSPGYWVDPASSELWLVTGFSGTPMAYRYRESAEGTLIEDRFTDPAIGMPWNQSDGAFLPRSVFGFAADDIYVGGAWCTSGCTSFFFSWADFDGAIAHYDGTSWSIVARLGKGEIVSMIQGTEAADESRRFWIWAGPDGEFVPQSIRLLSLGGDGGAPTTLFDQPVRLDARRGHPLSGWGSVGCHHVIGSTVSPNGAWFSDICMVYRWNGTSLEVPSTLTYGIPAGVINGIWAANEDEAWIVGEAPRRVSSDPPTGFAAKRTRVAP